MGGIRHRQPSAHQPLLYALPHHFLKQSPEHFPERGVPPPQLADRAVIRHPLIQVNAKIPTERIAVRVPLLNLPLRRDAVQKAQQQIFYHDQRVDGQTAKLPAVLGALCQQTHSVKKSLEQYLQSKYNKGKVSLLVFLCCFSENKLRKIRTAFKEKIFLW